ncbi:MAG TPA: vitamin K epoxide reductase family protein [Capillimicrobium sp.]|nr:vitamin K epoxide reductase family protein [Capillimicrobium sp.]
MSRRTIVMAVLAALGAAVAGYLTTVHYADAAPICALSGGCEKVQSSRYAELGGVPVALIGLAGYASILASLAVARGERGRLARAGMTAIGTGFSLYLTYLELFVIDAICQWCVASAAIMTALFVLAVWDFLYPRSDRYSSLAETPVSSATTAAAGRTRAPASTSR